MMPIHSAPEPNRHRTSWIETCVNYQTPAAGDADSTVSDGTFGLVKGNVRLCLVPHGKENQSFISPNSSRRIAIASVETRKCFDSESKC